MSNRVNNVTSPTAASSARRSRRSLRACDLCRRRKEKCDGREPRCTTCSDSGRECHYQSESKKRGLREGWVHSLEKLWALALVCRPDLEDVLIRALNDGISGPSAGRFAAQWVDEGHEECLLKRWRKSSLARHLVQMLPELEKLPRQKLQTFEIMNSPTALDLSEQHRTADCTLTVVPEAAQVANDGDHMMTDETRSNHVDPGNVLGISQPFPSEDTICIPKPSLPADSLVLLNTYFAHTHPWLPIVEKHHVYRMFYQCTKDTSLVSHSQAAPLMAIIYYERGKISGFLPNAATPEAEALQAFLKCASSMPLTHERKEMELTHAQALLITSLACLHRGVMEDAILMVAQASRVGYLVRAAVTHGRGDHSHASEGRLDHLLRACYCLDAILSARLHIPLPFPNLAGTDTYDVSEDGVDEWVPTVDASDLSVQAGPLHALSIFNQLTHAVQDMVTAFEVSKAVDAANVTVVAPIIARMEANLPHDASIDGDAYQALLPQTLTVILVRHLNMLLLAPKLLVNPNANALARVLCILGRAQDFCNRFTTKITLIDSRSIVPIWHPLWTLLLQQVDKTYWVPAQNDLVSGLSATIQAIIYSLAKFSGPSESPRRSSQFDTALAANMSRAYIPQPTGAGTMAQINADIGDIASNIVPQHDAPLIASQESSVDNEQAESSGSDNMQGCAASMPTTGQLGARVRDSTSVRNAKRTEQNAQNGIDDINGDLLATDAITWYDPFDQSLQNLGFAGIDDSEDLQSFFSIPFDMLARD